MSTLSEDIEEALADADRAWRRVKLLERRQEIAQAALRGNFDKELPQDLADRLGNHSKLHVARREALAKILGLPADTNDRALIDAAEAMRARLYGDE